MISFIYFIMGLSEKLKYRCILSEINTNDTDINMVKVIHKCKVVYP